MLPSWTIQWYVVFTQTTWWKCRTINIRPYAHAHAQCTFTYLSVCEWIIDLWMWWMSCRMLMPFAVVCTQPHLHRPTASDTEALYSASYVDRWCQQPVLHFCANNRTAKSCGWCATTVCYGIIACVKDWVHHQTLGSVRVHAWDSNVIADVLNMQDAFAM